MKITCSGHNKKTGKPCSRKVAIEGGWCYQHKLDKHVKIPEDISQVIGKKPIVIDDIGVKLPKEVFKTVIAPRQNNTNTAYLPDNIEYLNEAVEATNPFPKKPILINVEHDNIEHLNPSRIFPKKKGKIKYITITKNYSHPWIKKLWKRIKDFFKRDKK